MASLLDIVCSSTEEESLLLPEKGHLKSEDNIKHFGTLLQKSAGVNEEKMSWLVKMDQTVLESSNSNTLGTKHLPESPDSDCKTISSEDEEELLCFFNMDQTVPECSSSDVVGTKLSSASQDSDCKMTCKSDNDEHMDDKKLDPVISECRDNTPQTKSFVDEGEPMSEPMRKAVYAQRAQLSIVPWENVKAKLHVDAGGFLNDEEEEEIDACRTNRGKMYLVLKYLRTKNKKAFTSFCEALVSSDYRHFALNLSEAAGVKIETITARRQMNMGKILNMRKCAYDWKSVLTSLKEPLDRVRDHFRTFVYEADANTFDAVRAMYETSLAVKKERISLPHDVPRLRREFVDHVTKHTSFADIRLVHEIAFSKYCSSSALAKAVKKYENLLKPLMITTIRELTDRCEVKSITENSPEGAYKLVLKFPDDANVQDLYKAKDYLENTLGIEEAKLLAFDFGCILVYFEISCSPDQLEALQKRFTTHSELWQALGISGAYLINHWAWEGKEIPLSRILVRKRSPSPTGGPVFCKFTKSPSTDTHSMQLRHIEDTDQSRNDHSQQEFSGFAAMERFQPSNFSKQFTSLELTGVQLTGKKLGRGSDATVQEVNWLGTLCAAKQLHDILLEDDSPGGARRFIENFEKECTTWSKLVHPHIVQFLGVHFLSGSRVPILILEKMDISLRGYLEKHKKEEIPLSAKVYILRQVAQALSYLHSCSPPLVHHDLSPNNILLNEVSFVARVTDFGMSRALDSSKMTRKSSVKKTQAFMAPEALHSPPKYDEKLDVFSYGNVTMTTVTHKWPEPGPPNRYEGDKLIAVDELQRREQYLISFSPKENELLFPIIRSCLDNRPSRRPTSLQLVAQMRQIEASYPRIAPSGEATIAQLREGFQQKDTQLKQKDAQLKQKDAQLQQKVAQLRQYHTQLKDKDTQLQQKDAQIRQYRSQLTEKDTQLKEKDTQLKQKDTQMKQKDTQLKQKDTQLKRKDEDSGSEYALLLQDYQQLQQEQDRLKLEHDQLKASQQKPSPPASVQPLSIQPHQHKTPTKLPSAAKQESKSTKKLKIKELGTRKETLHFPHSHGDLWGIAVSPTGNIFVSDNSKHQIHVFNTQRQYIRTFSEEGTGKGQLKYPRGLAVDSNRLVYVANDGHGRVEVFKEDGSFVRQIGVGQLKSPWNVTIYGDRLYIPDIANNRVLTFNTSGELTQTIGGGRGGGPGQFRGPTAVAVYNNELYITDWDNDRVQVFSVNGQYNRELLRGQVRGPEDILIAPDGEVLIADWWNHHVAIFNTSGDLLHRLDVPVPRGLAINTNSELLVTGEDGVCVFT